MAPLPELAADPALERLLFVMAIVKAFTFIGATRALRWRLRSPISRARRITYALGLFAMGTALVLLVTNVAVGMVPFLFEATLVLMALLALGDRELHRALSARFPHPDRPATIAPLPPETPARTARR
jgi:hypothetical protein